MKPTVRMPVLLAILASLTVACGGSSEPRLTLDDDVSFELFNGKQDTLQAPYVAGSELTLFVNSPDEQDFEGWTLTSSDSEVFEILEVTAYPEDLDAQARAAGPGEAEIRVWDAEGELMHSAEVSVALPDRVSVVPHAYHFVSHTKEFGEVVPKVLLDRPATFRVHYWADEVELSGNGVLEMQGTEGLFAVADQTHLDEDGEWLRIQPRELGEHELDIMVAGVLADTLRFEAMDPSDVVELGLSLDETEAEDGDTCYAVALGRDAEGSPIYGLDPSWALGTGDLSGHGDVVRYEFDGEHLRQLSLSYGEHEQQAWIHGRAASVSSSNAVGCNTVSTSAAGFAWLLGLGLAWRRRTGMDSFHVQ